MSMKFYEFLWNSVSTKGPWADATGERVHQTIGNIKHTFKIQYLDLEDETSWEGNLSSTIFTIRSKIHTHWQAIKQCRINLINKVNLKENHNRQDHLYHTGDKVLLKNTWKTKFDQDSYIDPYTVTEVRNNGTARARKGNVTDTYNLCNITPFKE